MHKKILGIILILILGTSSGFSWSSLTPTPVNARYLDGISRDAEAVYLIDVNSQMLLWLKNEKETFNPASMTKIIILDMAYDWIKANNISLETIVPISAAADYRNAPPHSSLMFLQEGQKVTLLEILQGIAIPSGNDASVALAELMSGSVEAFVEAMNKHVESLGFLDMHFADTSGYSPENLVTAQDMALFTYQYIKKHPETLKELHSLRTFTYPDIKHGGDLNLPFRIRQENKNYLLGTYDGADGVKTGYIDEIGYNLTATAERKGRRVIAVVMGVQADNGADGSAKRADLVRRLFDYAYNEFQEVLLPREVGTLPLLGGVAETIPLVLGEPTYLLFPKDEGGTLTKTLNLQNSITYLSAPITEEERVGTASFAFKGKVIKEVPLFVEKVESAGWFKWLGDYSKMMWNAVFNS